MYKKKEIIIIILIITLTVFLALRPSLISSCHKDEIIEKEEIKEEFLNIKIEGELTEDNLEIKIPYGFSYGYIISKIEPYLNDYSIIDSDYTKRYYESTTIIIKSSDNNNESYNESYDNKININTASKDELMSIKGIGDKRASLIIEYRDINKITSYSELQSLIGVSNEIIEIIKGKTIIQ